MTPTALTEKLKSMAQAMPGYQRYVMLTYAAESHDRWLDPPYFTCSIQVFFQGGDCLEYEAKMPTMNQAVELSFQEIEAKLLKRSIQYLVAA